jgi:HAE1 family hydrophobic/amphiphilic exporter-1
MLISDFAIKRPLITVVTMVALVIFGAFALFKLKTDEFPDVAPPWLTVGVIYPGASPEVVEKEVLDRVEEQIGSIAGVKRIMSKAYDGYAMLMIEFLYEKDLNEASQDVRDAISAVRNELPQEIEEPIIRKFNDTDRPIVSVAVSSTVLSPAELTRLVDPGITRELRSTSTNHSTRRTWMNTPSATRSPSGIAATSEPTTSIAPGVTSTRFGARSRPGRSPIRRDSPSIRA